MSLRGNPPEADSEMASDSQDHRRGGSDVSSFCHLFKVLLPGVVRGQIITRKSQARFASADRSEVMYWGDHKQKYVFPIARTLSRFDGEMS